jgi:cell division protein FtsB
VKSLIAIILFVSTAALAGQSNSAVSQGSSANNINCGSLHVNCKPTVVYHTEKQDAEMKELRAQNEALKAENDKLKARVAYELALARKVITYRDNQIRRAEENRPGNNAFSVVGGASQTGLQTSQTPTSFTAKTVYEPDFGLMYQHDFSYVRGSIEATINGTVLLGLGIRF